MDLDLSIVIVSYNARADLDRCLESIHASAPRAAHEVIVVDNASADGSAEAAERWPGTRVLRNTENVGFSRATNAGIRASRGRNVLWLNSDTLVPAAALDRLLDVLDRHPDVAVVGPRLVDAQGRAELSFGRMIGPWNELRQKRLARSPAVEPLTRVEQFPDWVSGACLLVRRADADAVGLIDERFFMYTEDVDFCAAIRAAGRKILFTPEVQVVHLVGRSAATAPRATRDAYHQSRLAFYRKHHPLWVPALRLWQAMQRTGN
ncbi:MAG TPA: glycosyltransferase family 2 protein [Vicinamibacterales bacterium]|jgi:GT2 family glycosyltransferase|nr:glycosyltransferase family 2 protein [Vicinamibacterales bacterium]